MVWNEDCQKSFEALREACCSAPILAFPDFSKPFRLHTDASATGLGAALYQKKDGVLRVISYASRVLSVAEANYPAHKLEFLALKWAVTSKFREYLLGAEFEVYTDNNPLCYAMTTAKLDATSSRWVADLANFRFSVTYRAGRLNSDADALSRIPWPGCLSGPAPTLSSDESEAVLIALLAPVDRVETLPVSAMMIQGMETVDERRQRRLDDRRNVQDQAVHWAAEQERCPALALAYETLSAGRKDEQPPRSLRRMDSTMSRFLVRKWLDLRILDDVLHVVINTPEGVLERLIVPAHLTTDLVRKYHKAVGHLREDRTRAVLEERFIWKGLYTEVHQVLRECETCLRAKARMQRAPMVSWTATRPLELVHLDFLKMDRRGGYEDILIITDHFTRFAQAIPTKSQKAPATVNALVGSFLLHYGFPERILTDQGRNFEGKLLKGLCEALGITKDRTTPYRPQTNGQCERFNRTLMDMIKCSEHKTQWPRILPALTFAYNNTPHSATGYSPYYLLHGRTQRLPLDIEMGVMPGVNVPGKRQDYVDNLRLRLQDAFESARKTQAKPANVKKHWYDQRAKAVLIAEGDRVLVRKLGFRERHKTEDPWENGFYRVQRQTDRHIPVYKVKHEETGAVRILHRNFLLPVPDAVGPKWVPEDERNTASPTEGEESLDPHSEFSTGEGTTVTEILSDQAEPGTEHPATDDGMEEELPEEYDPERDDSPPRLPPGIMLPKEDWPEGSVRWSGDDEPKVRRSGRTRKRPGRYD